jgi:hypothetical protein
VDSTELARLIAKQSGVVARRQVLALGVSDADIERLLRRREWARAADGVYVSHTGPLAWPQRAWAGVLSAWPAALTGRSALRAHGLRGNQQDEEPIDIAIDASRRVVTREGLRIVRLRTFERDAQLHLGPPRLRIETVLLRLAASAASEDAAVAMLADACQARRTTAARMLAELSLHPRLPRRRPLAVILEDIASGAYSALERRYLIRVERPHGLPTGVRQRRVRMGRATYFRDVEYVDLGTVVELDGRLGHERAVDRWSDIDRDLAGAVSGRLTVRVGWRQVLQECRLASAIGIILTARGWTGAPRACGPGCSLA